MKAGSVRGLSIGYDTIKATPRDDGGRDLHEIRLHEISVVTLPMNPGAEVAGVKLLCDVVPLIASLTRDEMEEDETVDDLVSIHATLTKDAARSRV